MFGKCSYTIFNFSAYFTFKYIKLVSLAKWLTTEMAVRVAMEAVKLHGTGGLMDDMPVEHHYRDVITGTIAGGTSNMLKLTIGREFLGIDTTTS
ncbi:acyl-CoA dehydrogenase family protein [Thermodesulfobacteriota bacterium]